MKGKWRTGRKLGRTIYEQVGDAPSDEDRLLGMMDTVDLATLVVDSVNLRPILEERNYGLGQELKRERLKKPPSPPGEEEPCD